MNERQEAITDAYQYLLRLYTAVKKEADICRSSQLKEGNNLLLIVEGVRFLADSVRVTLGADYVNQEKVTECLRDFTNALEEKDMVAMVDVLTYEVMALLDDWREGYSNALEEENKQ